MHALQLKKIAVRIRKRNEMSDTPQRKCIAEFKGHIKRWQEESDLEPQEIVDAIEVSIEEYFKLRDEIQFKADDGVDGQ